jgi:hypothetical protein
MISGFSRYWSTVIDGDVLKSVLFSAHATVYDESGIGFFNKENMCEKNKWKVNERINCTNKKMGGLEIQKKTKTEHKFLLKGNMLEMTDKDGRTSIFTKEEIIPKKT